MPYYGKERDTQMNIAQTVFTVIAAAVTALYLILPRIKKGVNGTLLKTASSFCFVMLGTVSFVSFVNSGEFAPDGSITGLSAGIVLIGLVLGLIGDVLLDVAHKIGDDVLIGGMSAFALQHVAIMAASSVGNHGFRPLLLVISLAVGFAAAFADVSLNKKSGNFDFRGLEMPSVVYATLLASAFVYYLLLAIAEDPLFFTAAAAMALFLVSDVILSFLYFKKGLKNRRALGAVNLATYYAAQIVFALSVGSVYR